MLEGCWRLRHFRASRVERVFLDNSHKHLTPNRFLRDFIVPGTEVGAHDNDRKGDLSMAVISVVSNCEETVEQLETVLRDRGHSVRSMTDSQLRDAQRSSAVSGDMETGLFVVDVDCGPTEAFEQIKTISEGPSTAMKPVLVAASPSSERELARACAYGATGLLRKPFRTVETVPDTERALVAATPAE